MRKRFWKALGPIEFIIISLVVVVILAVFIWRYDSFKARAMESEARFFLQEIYTAQMHYRASHETYASLDELIGTGLVVINKNYYAFKEGSPPTSKAFLIEALGTGSLVKGQRWSVDQNHEIKKLSQK